MVKILICFLLGVVVSSVTNEGPDCFGDWREATIKEKALICAPLAKQAYPVNIKSRLQFANRLRLYLDSHKHVANDTKLQSFIADFKRQFVLEE